MVFPEMSYHLQIPHTLFPLLATPIGFELGSFLLNFFKKHILEDLRITLTSSQVGEEMPSAPPVSDPATCSVWDVM